MTETPPLPHGRGSPRRSFASLRSTLALMLREMSTSYGRSPGGYAWAIIEPAAGIALLSTVFSLIARTPPVGVSFAMFYATGMLPFMMFLDIQSKVSSSLLFSKQLLAYPTVTFIDAIAGRFLLNMMTQILVGYIIFTACLLLFETRVVLDLPVIVKAYALTACLGLGIGTLNAYIFTRFDLMQRFWSIMMRPMILLSGVIFPINKIPQPYRDYLWYNPVVHIIEFMRAGFYGPDQAKDASEVYILAIALTCMALGLVLLRRYHQDLLAL